MARGSALDLDDVLPEPDDMDWGRWRVAGDWLSERGDRRGLLIGLEHQLETVPLDRDVAQRLARRVFDLRREVRTAALAGWVPPEGVSLFWRFGFPISVSVGRGASIHDLDGLFDRAATLRLRRLFHWGPEPIASGLSIVSGSAVRHVRVGRVPRQDDHPMWRQIASVAWLGTASGSEIAAFGRFVASDALQDLVAVDLSFTRLEDVGLLALLPQLPPRLGRLALCATGITEAGVGALAVAPSLQGLEALELSRNDIGSSGAGALASNLGGLRQLRMGRTNLGMVGVVAVVEGLRRLTVLELDRVGLGDVGAQRMAESASGTLEELSLSDNEIGPMGARALFDTGAFDLEQLWLDSNTVGASGAEGFAERLGHRGLKHLGLGKNDLGDAGGAALVASGGCAGLEGLWLEGNGITERGVSAWRAAAPRLVHLSLAGNPIGNQGVAHLRAGGMLPSVHLDLSACGIDDVGVEMLLDGSFAGLGYLDLSENRITETGATALVAEGALLSSLHLSCNPISPEGIAALRRWAADPLAGRNISLVSEPRWGEASEE